MNDEERETLIESRNMLFNAVHSNEKLFEEKLTFIGAGAVGLSMAYLATLSSIISICLFYLSLSLIFAALCINLMLYLWTKKWFNDEIKEIDNSIKENEDRDTRAAILKINGKASNWNWICAIAMIFGLILMVIFVCINVNNKIS